MTKFINRARQTGKSTMPLQFLCRKDCGRCKGFEGNSPCCGSDWWISEYKGGAE